MGTDLYCTYIVYPVTICNRWKNINLCQIHSQKVSTLVNIIFVTGKCYNNIPKYMI